MKNCFFKTWCCISQVHDLIPIFKRSFRQPAQPKRDSAFEQKTRIVSSREIWGSSRNRFFSSSQRKSRAEIKQTFLERTQRRFGKFVFSFPRNCPITFGRFVRKSSKQLHTIQNDENHVSKKIKSCFYKYSISQDISNAGCKEPKYHTYPSRNGAVGTWLCIWTKNTYCSRLRDLRKFSKQIF